MKPQFLSLEDIKDKAFASYKEIEGFAGRGAETRKWPVAKLVVEEDWNDRTEFDDTDELAEGILGNKGTDPITVIALSDGRAIITDGERRYRAYLRINEWVEEKKVNREDWMAFIPAFVLPKATSRIDRMVKKLTANNSKPFTAMEEAMAYKKLMSEGFSQADIAKRMGKNRMHVSNRIVLSNITGIEKEYVAEKLISTTEWVKLFKLVPDVTERVNMLMDAKRSGEVITNQSLDDLEASQKAEVAQQAYQPEPQANVNPEASNEPEQEDDNLDEDEGAGETDPDENNDDEGKDWGATTRSITEQLDAQRAADALSRRHEASEPPKTGLAALLAQSKVDPPPPTAPVQTGSFTANQLLNKNLNETTSDQLPEMGSVNDTLKDILLALRTLDKMAGSNSKMRDETFKIDKKIRYLQGIAKGSMFGILTGNSGAPIEQ